MYQVLGWVKSSTELDHPLIWETTRNPCLASRLQCVSPYDPDDGIARCTEAQEQPRCGGTEWMLIGQHDEEHHSQRPKVTLQT